MEISRFESNISFNLHMQRLNGLVLINKRHNISIISTIELVFELHFQFLVFNRNQTLICWNRSIRKVWHSSRISFFEFNIWLFYNQMQSTSLLFKLSLNCAPIHSHTVEWDRHNTASLQPLQEELSLRNIFILKFKLKPIQFWIRNIL